VPAGYSKTPLWKKLGIRPGAGVVLLDAPQGWSVPELPAGAASASELRSEERGEAAELVIAFCRNAAALAAALPALAPRIFPDGAIWIAWPRRAGGHDSDIHDEDIRRTAIPLGLVDNKVAAIDEDWSGLKLVWREERRRR
jgi:hypothetical protein